MGGVGEHVYGPDFCYFIGWFVFSFVVEEVGEVAAEGFGVAGDVDYLFGGEGGDGVEKGLRAAGTGRVQNYDVDRLFVFGEFSYELGSVSVIEFYVFNIVLSGVLDGIFYGVLFEFHSYDFLCAFGGGEDTDGARAAVGVEDGLVLEVSVTEGLGVELLGLRVVDLVEGFG